MRSRCARCRASRSRWPRSSIASSSCAKEKRMYRQQDAAMAIAPAPAAPACLTKKDFESDQDVRWCPGCGDYAILNAFQKTMPDLGVPKEQIVFISGIGC